MAGWGNWSLRLRRRGRAAIEKLRAPGTREPPDANLLAVSDLHLGSDLRRSPGPGEPAPLRAAPPSDALDRQLGAMLDHYAAQRPGGLPWRLILAGDIVDFIAITRTPASDESVPFAVSAQERLWGLAPEPAKTVWKLERTLERHALLARRLAAFAAAGNEIVVIRGNHDAEWFWPEVQEALRDRLQALAPHADGLRDRIRFCDWFYLEPGRVYVEHGHLHDAYSAFDDALRPLERGKPHLMCEPVSTLALRYFGNRHVATLDTSEVEHWGVFDFVRWAVSTRNVWGIFADYVRMTGRILGFSAKASLRGVWNGLLALGRLGRVLDADDERLQRVRAVLRRFRADQEDLALGLMSLLKPPAEHSLLATAQLLYVDRIALGAGVVGSAAGLAAMPGSPLLHAGLALAVLAAAAIANRVLARMRGVDTHPKLLAAAHRVALVTGVPLIVMGHTHRPVDREVGNGSRYVNLGTWVGAARDVPGRRVGFPHLVVTGDGAELRRWGGESGVERLMTA